MAPSERESARPVCADDAPAEGGPAVCPSEKSCCAVLFAREPRAWESYERDVGFQRKNIIALFIFSVSLTSCLFMVCVCLMYVSLVCGSVCSV